MSSDTVILVRLSKGNLYYYEGNFYYPFLHLTGNDKNLVRLHVKKFKRENKDLITSDRASPDYKNLLQLFEEQMEKYARVD